jgi:hypothetical protein
VVIAPKLDRLFRSALDALTVVEDMRKRGLTKDGTMIYFARKHDCEACALKPKCCPNALPCLPQGRRRGACRCRHADDPGGSGCRGEVAAADRGCAQRARNRHGAGRQVGSADRRQHSPPERGGGVKLGGLNAKAVQNRDEAKARAEALRPIFVELTGKSSRAIPAELNARNVATPTGGKWHAETVLRVQRRLEAQNADN